MNHNKIELPAAGIGADAVINRLRELKAADAPWRNGRMFG